MPSIAFLNLTPEVPLWVPANTWNVRSTNGPATGLIELSTNKIMLPSLDFDSATAEYAQVGISMPPNWDEGTITFTPKWHHATAVTNFGVVWKMRGRCFSDGDALDAAMGTAQSSTDTGGTADTFYSGPESAAITLAGTPTERDLAILELYRDPAEGADTLAVDARLHGVYISLTFNGLNAA